MDQKKEVINKIKKDPLFSKTKEILEQEDFIIDLHNSQPYHKQTNTSIEPLKSSSMRKVVPERQNKTSQEIINNFDARSYDEVEELKKIFYSFFVHGDKIVQMKQQIKSKKEIKNDQSEAQNSKMKQIDKDKE